MKYIIFLAFIVISAGCSNTIFRDMPEAVNSQQEISNTWNTLSGTTMNDEIQAIEETEDEYYLFEDFTEVEEFKWGIVNDGVMWGKSQGRAEIVDDTLVFSGEIITRWGGFSSLRGRIDFWELSEYSSVKLRAKSDGREYRITFRDNQWGNISHRAVLDFKTPWEFEEITIPFSDLQPAYFGRNVKADPFEKESAREIGVILSDWVDWAFELVIDEVRFCKK